MNNILKTLGFAALVAFTIASDAAAEQVRVGFTAEPYVPFQSVDAAGIWHGWEVDFVSAICAEAKLDCVITPISWDGIIPALTSKKIDMIVATMKITDDRLKTIAFSDKYLSSPSGVIAAKDRAIQPTAESLKDKIIGMQAGTTHQFYSEKYFAPSGAEVRTYPTQDDAYNDLAAGRIDAVEADKVSFVEFLQSAQGACCELKGTVKDDPSIFGHGTGIGLRKEDTALREKLNAAIKAIRSNGTYDSFSKKYFDYDVYGQ